MLKKEEDRLINDITLTHIDVDLIGLADFRTLLQHELDANVRPAVEGINTDHSQGVAFGVRNAGVGVQDARIRHHDALSASTYNLASHIRTSELLISAIHTLTINYRESDLTAKAIMDEIYAADERLSEVAADSLPAGYVTPSRSDHKTLL